MNLCMIHEVSNNFVDELLELVHNHLLLEPNCLIANYYVATTLTQKLGLDYENTHVCVKGCVLFQREHKDDVTCPQCGGPSDDILHFAT